jgi:hypothetical protein
MIRLCLIATLSVLIANSAFAQQTSVDTLYSGLKKATSFTVGNDAIYIVEAGAHRVLKLGFDGKLIEKYGNRGSGNYQFDNPLDIATTNGLKLFVSDKGNNRIQVFDKRWQYLSSIKAKEQFQTASEITPTFLGVNKFGEVIFYNDGSGSLGKYNEDGAMLDQIPLPGDVKEVSGLQVIDGSIFVLDKKSELVHKISENGFYESFYKAEKGTAFYYLNENLFLSVNDVLYQHGRERVEKIKLDDGIKIKDLLVVEDEIYILTEKSLLKLRR